MLVNTYRRITALSGRVADPTSEAPGNFPGSSRPCRVSPSESVEPYHGRSPGDEIGSGYEAEQVRMVILSGVKSKEASPAQKLRIFRVPTVGSASNPPRPDGSTFDSVPKTTPGRLPAPALSSSGGQSRRQAPSRGIVSGWTNILHHGFVPSSSRQRAPLRQGPASRHRRTRGDDNLFKGPR